jgi:ribose transport system permease protein
MKNSTSGFSLFSQIFQAKYSLVWVLLIMFIYFSVTSSTFTKGSNLLEILRQSGISAILFLGLTWIIAAGEIDLAFFDVTALVSVLVAYFLKNHYSLTSSIILAFAGGMAFGVASGYFIGYLKFPALITTIALGAMAKSLANTVAEGCPIYISRGEILRKTVFGDIFGIPTLFIAALALYGIGRYIQERTVTGQHIFALGENRMACKTAGIKEEKVIFYLFLLSEGLASIAGILLSGWMSSGNPEFGASYFLDALTAVFLGSLIIKAGIPNVIGTLIGILILGILVNGVTLLGAPLYVWLIVKGALLVAGIIIVTVSRYKKQVPGILRL